MPGPVIICLVLAQYLQKRDTPGRKQQISSDDHQYHRHEEQENGRDRIADSDGDIVTAAQRCDPRQGHDPLCLRFPFSRVPGPEQLNRVCPIDLPDGIKTDE